MTRPTSHPNNVLPQQQASYLSCHASSRHHIVCIPQTACTIQEASCTTTQRMIAMTTITSATREQPKQPMPQPPVTNHTSVNTHGTQSISNFQTDGNNRTAFDDTANTAPISHQTDQTSGWHAHQIRYFLPQHNVPLRHTEHKSNFRTHHKHEQVTTPTPYPLQLLTQTNCPMIQEKNEPLSQPPLNSPLKPNDDLLLPAPHSSFQHTLQSTNNQMLAFQCAMHSFIGILQKHMNLQPR